jgi:hypothetical protein
MLCYLCYFVIAVHSADIRMGKGFSYPTGNGPDCGVTKRTNIDPPHHRCRGWYVVTHMSQVVGYNSTRSEGAGGAGVAK